MKVDGKVLIIESAISEKFKRMIASESETVSFEDLKSRSGKADKALVFMPGSKDYCSEVREALLVNPGIVFALLADEKTSQKDIVELVKCGVTETVNLDDEEGIREMISLFFSEDSDAEQVYRNNLINKYRDAGIITSSPEMAEIFAKVDKIAATGSTVLIYGENGTGKELIARSIHYFSKRNEYRFVGVNTGAIPDNLLEDELFGHVKGAFTSAVKDRKGKFEHAHRGTIFLDEISNMPALLQVKLLRILQEREFERVGDNATVSVDVRVIAATNKDLYDMVQEETFREDLYYRLNVIPLKIPPLRERKSDIPILASFFIRKYCQLNELELKSLTIPAIRVLQSYNWPGNVRQLENIMERMVVMNPAESIFQPSDIPEEVKPEVKASVSGEGFIPEDIPDEGVSLQEIVKNVEKKLILNSLEKTSWNKQKAANLLNIKRTTLIEKIKKIQQ